MKSKPALVQSFVNGIQRSLNWMNASSTEEIATELAKTEGFNFEHDVLVGTLNRMRNAVPKTAVVTEDAFNNTLKLPLAVGSLDKAIPFNVLEDNTFADARQVGDNGRVIVDTHLHIIADDLEKYPLSPATGDSAWAAERPLSAEDLVRAMDECGVGKAAVVQPSTVHGYDNSYVCDSAKRHPDRIGAVVSIDMTAPDAPETLRYWVKERGAVGLRLTASASGPSEEWLTDPAAGPAWEEAAALPIPVAIPVRNPRGLPYLQTMLERYPKLTFLLDHIAHPKLDAGPPYPDADALLELARFDNLYLKVTTHALEALKDNPRPFLQSLVDRFGASRLMWGSNIPRFDNDYGHMVGLLRSALAVLSDEDADWLSGKTALSVYRLMR